MRHRNYRFYILSFLYDHREETVNIRALLDEIAAEGHYSLNYLLILVQSMHYNGLLSLPGNASPNTTTEKLFAKIEAGGINEYKKLYSWGERLYLPQSEV